jgi:hypothetical protein
MVRIFPVLTTAVLLPAAAAAQVTYEGCQDNLGTPVASVVNPAIPDIAIATVAVLNPALGPRPVIYYQPSVVQLPSPLRRLIYFHECAHHALGQVIAAVNGIPISMPQEQAADCWAIVRLVQSGEFRSAQVQLVQAAFSMSPGNATHLPGPIRAANFAACLAAAGVEPLP